MTRTPASVTSAPLSRHQRLLALLITVALAAATFAVVSATPAEASHFRSTQLTWEVMEVHPDGSVDVEFTSTVAARRSFYGSPTVGDTIQPVHDFEMGDGNTINGGDHTVTLVDEANDWVQAERSFEYTYSERGEYTAFWEQCCRLRESDGHINNDNLQNRIETFLDLSGDPDDPVPATSSPVSLISPLVDCSIDDTCEFTVPAVDAQGFGLNWRFATGEEATISGSADDWHQPGDPHADNDATIDASNGRYLWDTTGATLAPGDTPTYYSTQVVIEKLDNNGTIVATTAVDFFIRMGDDENHPPEFVDPTPADGSTFRVVLGSEISFDVAAEDPDEDDTVTLGLLGAPADADFDSEPDNPATGTFSWTPTEVGSSLLTLTARDDIGLGAVPRSLTLIAALVTDLDLAPENATSNIDELHTVTATATTDAGDPIAQALVSFEVTDGPHAGTTHEATTDENGEVEFSYEGTEVGSDTIVATHTSRDGDEVSSNESTVEWTEEVEEVEEVEEAEPAEPVEEEPDYTG